MSTVDLSTIIDAASAKLTGSYELDADFIANVKKALQQVLKKYYIYDSPQQVVEATGGASGKKKEKKEKTDKKPRKKSAYNIFVKEKMPEFKEVPHGERMGKIGALWKSLDEAGKQPFQTKADEVNAAQEAEDVASASVPVVAVSPASTTPVADATT